MSTRKNKAKQSKLNRAIFNLGELLESRTLLTATVVEGSGLGTTITANAGDTVSFQYDLISSASSAANAPQAVAYYTINGTAYLLNAASAAQNASIDLYGAGVQTGNAASGDPTNGYTYSGTDPFNTYSFVVPAGVSGTTAFGVGILGLTNNGASALLVDNVTVTPKGSTTPVQISNGGFENDFNGYSTDGGTIPYFGFLGNIAAPEGSQFAALTDSTANDLLGTGAADTNLGNVATASGTTSAQLNALANLTLLPPQVDPLSLGGLTEGQPFSLGGTVHSTHNAGVYSGYYSGTINFGDGSAVQTLTFPTGTNAFIAPVHTYNQSGSYPVTVTVTDPYGQTGTTLQSQTAVVAHVNPSAVITGAPKVGTSGTSITLGSVISDPSAYETSLGISPSWTITGGTYTGGTVTNGSNFTFTPTGAGVYTVKLTATDHEGYTGTNTVTINVSAPTFSLKQDVSGLQAGAAYSHQLVVDPSYASVPAGLLRNFAISSGSLPAGLILTAGGVISGTPTTVGAYSFTVTCTDSNTPTAATCVTTFSGTVVAPTIVFVTSSLPAGQVNSSYSQSVVVSGGVAPYAYSVSAGSLPDGLSLNSTTGVISGTPTTATVGSPTSFTVSAHDSTNTTVASNSYSINIAAAVASNPVQVQDIQVHWGSTTGALTTSPSGEFQSIFNPIAGHTITSGANSGTNVLPWPNLNEIEVAFNQTVANPSTALASAVTLVGKTVASYPITYLGAVPGTQGVYLFSIGAGMTLPDNLKLTVNNTGISSGTGTGTMAAPYTLKFSDLPGDANGSAKVDSTDRTQITTDYAPNAYNVWNDLNGDGVINASDATNMNSYILSHSTLPSAVWS